MSYPLTFENDRMEGRIRSQIAKEKIESLLNEHASTKRSSKLQEHPALPLKNFIHQLFEGASTHFIEFSSREHLHKIVEQAYNAALHLLQGNGTAQGAADEVICTRGAGPLSLIIALRDRPFIVRSIAEATRIQGLDIRTILHPIYKSKDTKISVVYLEMTSATEEEVLHLQSLIERILGNLVLATDDFSAMLIKVDTLAASLGGAGYAGAREYTDFLRWLLDGSFIFQGYCDYSLSSVDSSLGAMGQELLTPRTLLGIFKTKRSSLLQECQEDLKSVVERKETLLITKLSETSEVQRRLKLLHFAVVERDEQQNPVRVHSIVGILTLKAQAQEVSSIPLLRGKVRDIVESEGAEPNSYNHKYIVDTIERMPRDLALALSHDELHEIIKVSREDHHNDRIRVALLDQSPLWKERGLVVVTFVPKERFSSELHERVEATLRQEFSVTPASLEYHLDVSLEPQVRMYFYVPKSHKKGEVVHKSSTIERLEDAFTRFALTFQDSLEEALVEVPEGPELFRMYCRAFSKEYEATHSGESCRADILIIESLNEKPLHAQVISHSSGEHLVKIFKRGEELTVSKLLPVLENAGLEVLTSSTHGVTPTDREHSFIHTYSVRPKNGDSIPMGFPTALEAVLLGRAESDHLNALLVSASLPLDAVRFLRAYSCLLWQVNKFATRGTIFDTLASNPESARALWNLFELRFNPELKLPREEREAKFHTELAGYREKLRHVKDLTQDRILRSLGVLLEHTVRTNFYQKPETLAFKLHSEKIDILPSPKPMYEIFVRSVQFEGIHLRASMVARGGIRWSERNEDYRSEVLGLMKTQRVKNVLIVPSGAKGGFVVRHLPSDRAKVQEIVKSCYQEYIRALLSITDNRVGTKVKHPEGLIIYDDFDPYFVVAADKGTATFSDIANAIAVEEFDFWLGDAFASGGSHGYDHKKYAITAKGAWECAKRHFHDIGLNYETSPFTVVGIGDMSGDVFGNGLLRSDKMKLMGAFNHAHVFVDPSPDPAVSFEERKRLFTLPRSQWTDYNPELISKGGGVFGRFDKEIQVTPEMRSALGIPDTTPSVITGEELISYILKAPCDLLWNGGIGTYFKSRFESHAEVNDGTNDQVRINADELRAKVVAEGGNLGFTQRARIEYSTCGGRINTDAIDNSAGVDMSDHEVNLKLLFGSLISKGKITREERDTLLVQMGEEVTQNVLDHNRSHAGMLSIAEQRSRKSVPYFQSLLMQMAKSGYINRALDFLPEDEDLTQRVARKGGLTRPELALCLAAVKMWIKDSFLHSELVNEPLLQQYLIDYFPSVLQERFKKDILEHPLASNITAMQVTNTIVDAVGITFVHRMCLNYAVPPRVVLKCALAAEILLQAQSTRKELSRFDNPQDNALFIELRRAVSGSLRDATAWFISLHGHSDSLGTLVSRYSSALNEALKDPKNFFGEAAYAAYLTRKSLHVSQGVSEEVASRLAVSSEILTVLDLSWTSLQSRATVKMVREIRERLSDIIGLSAVSRLESMVEPSNKWEHQLLIGADEEIRKKVSSMILKCIHENLIEPEALRARITKDPHFEQLLSTIEEIRQTTPTAPALAVVAKQVRSLDL